MPAGAGELEVILSDNAALTDQRVPTNESVTPVKMPAGHKGVIITTSTARGTDAASPVEGQQIYETDTDRVLVNVGTPAAPVWRRVNISQEVAFARENLEVGNIPLRWQVPAGGMTIVEIRANIFTPSTSGSIVADLQTVAVATPGTISSLYSVATKPTLVAGTTADAYGINAALPDVATSIPAGDWLVAELESIGTGALGFTMQVRYVQNG